MNNISISVIMPAYNSALFIKEAIDSILSQTFSAFEFIIINDGSEDDTENMILSYQDDRIKYLKLESNHGNYHARNQGLKMSKGEYIAVMDADDIAFQNRLKVQKSFLDENTDVLGIGTDFLFRINGEKYNQLISYEEIKLMLLRRNCFMHSSLMIRKSIIEELNGYNEIYKYSSDYDLICRIANRGQIRNISTVLMIYRWHPMQISQCKHSEQLLYAKKVRLAYQLDFINKFSLGLSIEADNYMIYDDKIGEVIALYVYSKFANLPICAHKADNLLDIITDNLDWDNLFEVSSFGCVIIFLVRNKLIREEEDELLEVIDTYLETQELIHRKLNLRCIEVWIHYFVLRLGRDIKTRSDIRVKSNICIVSKLLDLLFSFPVNDFQNSLWRDIALIHQREYCPNQTNRLFHINM